MSSLVVARWRLVLSWSPLQPCRGVSWRFSSSDAVHQLVSQGRYCEAVLTWEAAKAAGSASPGQYAPLMRMAQLLASAETARELRRDMQRQQWPMDSRCVFHYVCALISEGFVEEAVLFLSANHTQEPECLCAVSERLECAGHYGAALHVCGLGSSPLLHGRSLELLGRMGDSVAMETLLAKHYSGSRLPEEVQLGLANGLALSGDICRAVSVAAASPTPLPARSLALLIEAINRTPSTQAAISVIQLLPCAFSGHHTLRAINAAMMFQAICHREGLTAAPIVKVFVERNLWQELKAAALTPDVHTCQALLLLYCFDASVKGAVYRAVSESQPASLLGWVEQCGPLQPAQANRVLGAVLVLSQTLDLQPDIEPLLSLQVPADRMLVIHWAKSMVLSHTVLQQSCSTLLCAVAGLSEPKALYAVFGELLEAGWEPTAEALQQLVDSMSTSVLMSGEAAYGLWRLLVRERIAPSVQLLNKLLKCCQQTCDIERALFFLSVFSEYQLQPSIESFSLLLQVCSGDNKRTATLLKLATIHFPEHFSSY